MVVVMTTSIEPRVEPASSMAYRPLFSRAEGTPPEVALDADVAEAPEVESDTNEVLQPTGSRVLAALYVALHFVPFLGLWTGFGWPEVLMALGLLWVRVFAITAGYHRYFSHRSFKTSRWFQFVLAFWAQSSGQKGVLWWAAHHRHHHRNSDQPNDVHSPVVRSFWYSHVGWIFDPKNDATHLNQVKDLTKFPELMFLERFHWIPPVLLGVAVWLIQGWSGLWIGFFASTMVLYHVTYTINSLSHVFGSRRFATTDDSRNNFWLALLTLGEGWHNNHHHYMASCRQGFYWWEIDITYYGVKALEKLGLVWDIREPPARCYDRNTQASADMTWTETLLPPRHTRVPQRSIEV